MLNKILQFTIAAILTVPVFAGAATIDLPATNQTTCFNAGGNPLISCAGLPGQDGDLRAGVAWPNPRFIDNANGTMTDTLTGLILTKDGNAPDPNGALPNIGLCPNSRGDMSWPQALDYIACLNTNSFLGFADWRLPNLNELESLVNAEVIDSSVFLNTAGFINVKSSTYWSATTDAQAPAFAWDVSLRTGDFLFSSEKLPVPFNVATQGRGVWPVRGTSTLPAQLWKTGQTRCFSEAGVARACAPAEAGAVTAGADWPVPRFVANAAATVAADRLTGLLWPIDTQTPGPANCTFKGLSVTWQNAIVHVDCLNTNSFLGFSDWRLPNRKELRSLIDYSKQGPALPAGHPFNNAGIGQPFWTSTTEADIPARAWTVSTSDGSINGVDKTAVTLHVLPVRGPDVTAPALTMNPVASPTRLASLTVSGTMEAGITPVVTVTAPATAGPVSITGTTWSSQISGLTEGAHSITVTAVDLVGNVSTITAAVTVNLPAGGFTPGAAVSVLDALKALRIAVGLIPAPLAGSADMLHGDVAPLGAPDGRIDASDALLILKKAVGLVSF
jgi:Protein of unknown function (DUF1566)